MSESSQFDAATRRVRFEQSALPHLRRIYSVALRLARRPEDASDLVQETYLRAYRGFDRFQAGTDCRSWLLTILHSAFADKYRQRQREGHSVPVEDVEDRFRRALAAEVEWDTANASLDPLGPEVASALAALPESFRATVLLVDVQGLSYEEAAAALRCPLGTLRSRLFRARKLLFVALSDYARRAGYLRPDQ